MRCSGSPTTSPAVDAAGARAIAQRALQAVVFREVLRPLTATLGPLADAALAPVVDSLARERRS